MNSGPSNALEAFVALLVPPACREEVLGDLYERYRSRRQYAFDALRVVPLVVLSRIRRTADPQLLLILAFSLYVPFLAAAWFWEATLLQAQYGLLRLAIPAALALIGLMLEDAYAYSGKRSPLGIVRGPALGLGLALVSQALFWFRDPNLAVPRTIFFYGCAMSLLMSSAVRLWLRLPADQLQGANALAVWLKQAEEPVRVAHGLIWTLKAAAAIVAVAIVGTWIGNVSPALRERFVAYGAVLVVLVAVYQVCKQRG